MKKEAKRAPKTTITLESVISESRNAKLSFTKYRWALENSHLFEKYKFKKRS